MKSILYAHNPDQLHRMSCALHHDPRIAPIYARFVEHLAFMHVYLSNDQGSHPYPNEPPARMPRPMPMPFLRISPSLTRPSCRTLSASSTFFRLSCSRTW